MRKILKATYNKPVVAVSMFETRGDELTTARTIATLQNDMVYKLRQELEKQMASVNINDITFTLEDEE